MNELIFILHACFIVLACLAALRQGKNALISFIALSCVLANVFVLKQTTLFGLYVTCSDAFTIGATLGLNLLQEYFGKTETKKSIWINFGSLLFLAIVSKIHLLYKPALVDVTNPSYEIIFGPAPRIVIASLVVFLIAQTLDAKLYGIFKKLLSDRFLVLRNYASLFISQLVDTVLFSFLGLYGLIDNVWHIILVSYAVKVIAIIIATPLVHFSRNLQIPPSSH